jgi:hypothetical protein
MPSITTVGNVRLESFFRDVEKDIIKQEAKNRESALKHVAKKMRKNISQRGVSNVGEYPGRKTGNLRKGIKYRLITNVRNVSFVGSISPHAHLLEFGHGDGKTFNKRPFVHRTLSEEEPMIIKLMNESYF